MNFDTPAGMARPRSLGPLSARLCPNPAVLHDSRHIVILITGESKRLTYSSAVQSGPADRTPVGSVLRQRRTPVDVMWSPPNPTGWKLRNPQ
jgi:6-phosphogluconolactonase/glucosamine-6-phosphate isomerase/deaminase